MFARFEVRQNEATATSCTLMNAYPILGQGLRFIFVSTAERPYQ